jgi:hypothetical protein
MASNWCFTISIWDDTGTSRVTILVYNGVGEILMYYGSYIIHILFHSRQTPDPAFA